MTNEELAELKLIFVTREECQESREAVSLRLSKSDIALAEIKTKLNISLGILSAIGIAMLGVAVKMLFGV